MLSDQFSLYWGDAHTNLRPHAFDQFPESFQMAKDLLDFWAIAYYAFEIDDVNGYGQETVHQRPRLLQQWKALNGMTAEANEPGRFVCFPGYEWHGDRRVWGDVNVFYPYEDGELADPDTLRDLYDYLRKAGGLAIPHHPGYQPRERGKDWSVLDEELSPFVEIFSGHGSSEGYGSPLALDFNPAMGPLAQGGAVHTALARGHHLGIICSGDLHSGQPSEWGKGVMACYSKELTRESLWESFKARRVYGVTGDRIRLDISVAGLAMGQIGSSKPPYAIHVAVEGCDAIARIELLRNNVVVRCQSFPFDAAATHQGRGRYKLRSFHGWGPRSEKHPEVGPRTWDIELEVQDGRLLSLEKLWMLLGQKVEAQSEQGCRLRLTSGPPAMANHSREKFPGMIYEIEGTPETRMNFLINGHRHSFTLAEARQFPGVFAEIEESEAFLESGFGITRQFLQDNQYCQATIWHNAYKSQFWPGVHQSEFTRTVDWEDTPERDGESWYYVRAVQYNGQIAWSSPVWVTPG